MAPPVAAGALGACVLVLLTGSLMLLSSVRGDWDGWQPATCLDGPRGCFCEHPRANTLIRQPANTFSNLAFAVVGVAILLECALQELRRHWSPRPAGQNALGALGSTFACVFAISQVALGAGSAFFHASLTFPGQWVDNVGMYLVVTAPALYARACVSAGRSGQASAARRFAAEWLVTNIACGAAAWHYPEASLPYPHLCPQSPHPACFHAATIFQALPVLGPGFVLHSG
eukprot:gene3708-689_t